MITNEVMTFETPAETMTQKTSIYNIVDSRGQSAAYMTDTLDKKETYSATGTLIYVKIVYK